MGNEILINKVTYKSKRQNLISYNESSHSFVNAVQLNECHLPVLPARVIIIFLNVELIKIQYEKQIENLREKFEGLRVKVGRREGVFNLILSHIRSRRKSSVKRLRLTHCAIVTTRDLRNVRQMESGRRWIDVLIVFAAWFLEAVERRVDKVLGQTSVGLTLLGHLNSLMFRGHRSNLFAIQLQLIQVSHC